MRTDNTNFQEFNQLESREPRFVFELQYKEESYFFCSHNTEIDADNVLHDVLINASGTSQKINPDKANSQIGAIRFDVLDDGVTDILRDKLLEEEEGVKGRRVKFYVGFADLEFDEYILATTQIVDSVSHKNRRYTFQCADVQRMARKEIFDAREFVLLEGVKATDTTIRVFSTAGAQMVMHPTVDGSPVSGRKVMLLELEGEDDQIEIAIATSFDGSSFTVERGALGTLPVEIEMPEGATSNNAPKIKEFVYFNMPAPMAAYAALTGYIYGYAGERWPSHWHAGIPLDLVATTDFASIGEDLWSTQDRGDGLLVQFLGPEKTDAKRFVEEQLLQLMGCFPKIYNDGQLGIQRAAAIPSQAGYVRALTDREIVDHSDLTHDLKSVINYIELDWNRELNREGYTRRNVVLDEQSIKMHGRSDVFRVAFDGLYGNHTTYKDIYRIMSSLRDRYAGPPLRMTATLTPEQNDLEVGDVVRVRLPSMEDYSQSGESLDRNFEIQQVQTDWKTGRVRVELFGSSQLADDLPVQEEGTAIPDEAYTARGTAITPQNFGSNVVRQGELTRIVGNITLTGSDNLNKNDSIFYTDGPLTIEEGATVFINNNVLLAVRGHFQLNGKIDGVGRGLKGGSGATQWDSWDQSQLGEEGFLAIGSLPQAGLRVDFTSGRWNAVPSSVRETGGKIPAGSNTPSSLELLLDNGIGANESLWGSSGSGGGATHTVPEYQPDPPQTVAGARGANSGSGLLIVARGMTVSLSGEIDVSAEAEVQKGAAGAPVLTKAPPRTTTNTFYSGSGAPAASGACYVLIDGNNIPPTLQGTRFKAYTSSVSSSGRRLDPSYNYDVRNRHGFGDNGSFSSLRGLAPDPRINLSSIAFRVQRLTGTYTPSPDIPNTPPKVNEVILSELTNTPRSQAGNISTVEVSVKTNDPNFSYAIIDYREEGESGWFEHGPAAPEASVVLPSDGKTYVFRARGVSVRGAIATTGPEASIKLHRVRDPNSSLPDDDITVKAPNVRGLELFGQALDTEFTGRDAKFVWRQVTVLEFFEMGSEGRRGAGGSTLDWYFQDYVVEIWAQGRLLRTEFTRDPEYIYTYEKNKEDYWRLAGNLFGTVFAGRTNVYAGTEEEYAGLITHEDRGAGLRQFEVRVRARTTQNTISDIPAVLQVQNTAPMLLSGWNPRPSFHAAAFEFERPSDLDFDRVEIYINEQLAWSGSDSPAVIEGLEQGTTYSYYYAVYDAFGLGAISQDMAFTTDQLEVEDVDGLQENLSDLHTDVQEAWQETIKNSDKIAQEVQDRINAISGLGNQISDLNSELSALQAEIDGIIGAPEWDAGEAYLEGQLVKFDGSMYRAVQDVPVGTPVSDANYWVKVGDYESIGDIVAAHSVAINSLQQRVTQTESGLTTTSNQLSALTNRVTTAEGDVLANTSAIDAINLEITQIDNSITAIANSVNALTVEVANNAANILTESQIRASEDAILASRIDRVEAFSVPLWAGDNGDEWLVGTNEWYAGVWTETSARIEGDTALGQRIDVVTAQTDDKFAAFSSDITALVNADEAIVERLETMRSDVDNNTGLIHSEAQTRADADGALASDIATVAAAADSAQQGVSQNTAAIQSEAQARADADGALASSIDTVATQVDDNTAAVQQQALSIGGLEAQYVLTVSANGQVTGMKLAADESGTSFDILADRFTITQGAGQELITPFAIQDGWVMMDKLRVNNINYSDDSIDDSKISGVSATKFRAGTISADVLIETQGKVRVSSGANGQYKTVLGPQERDNETYVISSYDEAANILYFGVKSDGHLVARGAEIQGDITGSDITGGTISGSHIVGSSIRIGSSDEYIELDPVRNVFNGVYIASHSNQKSSSFTLDPNGETPLAVASFSSSPSSHTGISWQSGVALSVSRRDGVAAQFRAGWGADIIPDGVTPANFGYAIRAISDGSYRFAGEIRGAAINIDTNGYKASHIKFEPTDGGSGLDVKNETYQNGSLMSVYDSSSNHRSSLMYAPLRGKLKRVILEDEAIGVGQSWYDVNLANNTFRTNNTGRPIMVVFTCEGAYFQYTVGGLTRTFGSGASSNWGPIQVSIIVPDGDSYKYVRGDTGQVQTAELR